MIRKIILQNYMSHAYSVIEPAAGLTVLIGPNNCGKSAVIHALENLCYNRPADYAIRHDEKEAVVTVETDDGHVLTWRRRKNSVTYLIDGREVGRLGQGGVPDDLHTHMRMPKIEPAGDPDRPFFIHFGLQKDPIFLLDEPAARRATFFASSSDAEKLLRMQKLHKEKVLDARRESEQLRTARAATDRQLGALLPLAELRTEVAAAERAWEELQAAAGEIEALSGLVREISAAEERCLSLRCRSGVLLSLSAPPDMSGTEPLRCAIEAMGEVLKRQQQARARSGVLAALTQPPTVSDTHALEALAASIRAAREERSRCAGKALCLSALEDAPDMQDASGLGALVHEIGGQVLAVEQARLRARLLEALGEPPEFKDPAGLKSLIGQWEDATRSMSETSSALDRLRAEQEDVRRSIRRWTDLHPRCPTCGARTDMDTLLAEDHAHG